MKIQFGFKSGKEMPKIWFNNGGKVGSISISYSISQFCEQCNSYYGWLQYEKTQFGNGGTRMFSMEIFHYICNFDLWTRIGVQSHQQAVTFELSGPR